MKLIDGFSQEQLDYIWKSLSTDRPYPATKVVDDSVEKVMTINTPRGQLAISKDRNGRWEETTYVGQ